MELSLRLDTLGMVELRFLRGRDRFRDWPQFQLLAASRQARIMAYLPHDVAEQLHQQVLLVESAVGLSAEDEDEDEGSSLNGEESERDEETKSTEPGSAGSGDTKHTERESSSFSPAFAQALKQLNELARQRLPDANTGITTPSTDLSSDPDGLGDEEDALEQLQDAFIQMMEVVRELAEEMSTDALKLTGRFRCARTNIEFVSQVDTDDDDDDDDDDEGLSLEQEGMLEVEVELVMVLQLFEEGRSRIDDVPAVELQLDVDDFERLHETLDIALEQERRSNRRRR